jgi:hypothetical protein
MSGKYTIILRLSKDGDQMEYVLYNGKKYLILYKYTSGFCEIKEVDSLYNIELVHTSELTNLN